jgi:hypothetical protein
MLYGGDNNCTSGDDSASGDNCTTSNNDLCANLKWLCCGLKRRDCAGDLPPWHKSCESSAKFSLLCNNVTSDDNTLSGLPNNVTPDDNRLSGLPNNVTPDDNGDS